MTPAIKQTRVRTKSPTDQHAPRRLPHERDESEDSQSSGERDDIKQAYQDLKEGQMDTDLRGVQGVDHVTSPPQNDANGKARKNAPRGK